MITSSHLWRSILLIGLLFVKKTGSQNVTKVQFQVDGKASEESMLDAGIGAVPRLTQVTFCFRLFLLYSSAYNPIVSYFAEFDNEISIGIFWDSQDFEFACCQHRVTLLLRVTFKLRRWNHVCIAANLQTRQYWFALNERFEEGVLPTNSIDELYIDSGGRLVVGQELDSIEGGLNFRQSLSGDLAQFQFFSEALEPSYLEMYVKCQVPKINTKPLFSFDKEVSGFQVKGSTTVSEATLKDICKDQKEALFMLPEKRIFRIAQEACTRMKSTLAIPRNKAENTEIFDDISRFNDHCVDAYGSIYWLGGRGDLETEKWIYLNDGSEVTWSYFAPGYEKVLDSKYCLSVGGLDFPYLWYATNCEMLTCPLCNFSIDALLHVRGLCKNTLVDENFSLFGYRNFKVQFLGVLYTNIYWNDISKTWVLDSRAEEGLTGVMQMTSKDDYPIGVKTWNITGDKCMSNIVELLITACNSNEYTCNDGTCIAKHQRCDMTIDCPDKSDEEGCNIVIVPFGYSTQLPPPKNGTTPLSIGLFLGITSVREINILGLKMAVDVILELRWRDQRLQMKNIRANTKSNKVQDPGSVWRPELEIGDGSSSLADLMLRSSSLMVEKESNPIPDDDTRLHEDDIYLGSLNTLYQQGVYTIGFTCIFQLHRYPFDKQMCSLTFRLTDVSSDFVVLTQHATGVEFLGQRKLLEYEVTMVNITHINSSQDALGQKVAIELRNLYGYYISNTYIPTTLLVVICYSCLFFDVTDFTDRVMVSLTSLLVLSSLFTTTSQSIPKTSYLKLIDLWFVVLIIFLFLMVVILVIIENFRLRNSRTEGVKVFVSVKPQGNNGLQPFHGDENNGSSKSAELLRNHIFVNFLAQIIMPFFIVIFIIAYASVCYSGL